MKIIKILIYLIFLCYFNKNIITYASVQLNINIDDFQDVQYILVDEVYDEEVDTEWVYYKVNIPDGSYDVKFYLSNMSSDIRLYTYNEYTESSDYYENNKRNQNSVVLKNIHGDVDIDVAVNANTSISYELIKEEGSTKEESKLVKLNKVVNGKISTVDDTDYFKFKVKKTGFYNIKINALGTNNSNFGYLSYECNKFKGDIGLGRASKITLKCKKGKFYYIKLNSSLDCSYKILVKGS